MSTVGNPTELLDADELAWFRHIGGVSAEVSSSSDIVDLDGAYRRWFDKHHCQMFLARPDFYVFAAGDHTDIPQFFSSLRRAGTGWR